MGIGATRALLALGLALVACAPAPAQQPQPALRATAEGDGNSVEVAVTGQAATVDVWSNRGIGGAKLTLLQGPTPDPLTLRLHLRAMEELRLGDAAGTTVVAVSSGPGHEVRQWRIAPDGTEGPLEPGDPRYLAVTIVAANGQPAIPLIDGHFAVTLPADTLAEGEGALTIQWVDFFR